LTRFLTREDPEGNASVQSDAPGLRSALSSPRRFRRRPGRDRHGPQNLRAGRPDYENGQRTENDEHYDQLRTPKCSRQPESPVNERKSPLAVSLRATPQQR
jgi:hypothetical protein